MPLGGSLVRVISIDMAVTEPRQSIHVVVVIVVLLAGFVKC